MILKKLLSKFATMILLMSASATLAISNNLVPVPKQFRGSPSQPVLVQFHEYWWELPEACGIEVEKKAILYGCYRPDTETTHVLNPCYYPEAKDNGSFAYIMCHEKGHIKGWVH